MRSTFHGLEVAKRSLFTHQTALNTTAHNLANANTIGYSRQRVNMVATRPLEMPGMMRSNIPGQLGTGVEFDSIRRVRDTFLDFQFRRENQLLGEWEIRDATLRTIEGIINEPSEHGIQSAMNRFWDAWEALNRDPKLLSARVAVLGEALSMVETFNHAGRSLNNLMNDLDASIAIKISEANNIIQNIAHLNYQIRRIEGLGDNANDFRDQRDLLVDQLSKIVDVQVEELADGTYNIVVAGGIQVVNGDNAVLLENDHANNAVSGELAGYVKAKEDVTFVRNQLNALVNTLITGEVTVTLPAGYVAARDLVAASDVTLADGTMIPAGETIPAGSVIETDFEIVVKGFNGLHELGYGLDEPATAGIPFFVSDGETFTIDNIRVNPEIVKDTNKIAASGQYETVDGRNIPIKGNSDIAHALAGLRDKVFTFPENLTALKEGTTDDFFRAVVGDLGVKAADATRTKQNQQDIVYSIDMRRQSVSGVSLDEEMADLIRFQHAYNAAARNVTVVDEILDRVINHMGIVGR